MANKHASLEQALLYSYTQSGKLSLLNNEQTTILWHYYLWFVLCKENTISLEAIEKIFAVYKGTWILCKTICKFIEQKISKNFIIVMWQKMYVKFNVYLDVYNILYKWYHLLYKWYLMYKWYLLYICIYFSHLYSSCWKEIKIHLSTKSSFYVSFLLFF